MKRFRFHLQRILNIRDAEKQQREMELINAIKKFREEERKLKELYKIMDEARNIETILLNTKSIYYLLQRERYLVRLKRLISDQEYRLRAAKGDLAVAEERLRTARIEQEKIEKIKSRSFRRWQKEFNLEERKFNDETAALLINYRNLTGSKVSW